MLRWRTWVSCQRRCMRQGWTASGSNHSIKLQYFNQSHADDVVKGNRTTVEQRRGRGGRNANGRQSRRLQPGDGRRQIVRFVAQMVGDAGRVTAGELINRAGGVAGPDYFHRRMFRVGAELQMHVLRGVKNGFPRLVAERGDKSPRLIRPADGEAEMMKGQMWIGHGRKSL